MNLIRLLAASVIVLILTGCAHPISVTPKMSALDQPTSATSKITARVGYYIPTAATTSEVTTPGGGGDNVRYFPYRDIEAGFQKILSNVFTSVVKLASVGDTDAKRTVVDFVLVPEMVTTSGGSGLFTWPPTSFTVDLTSNIRDNDGKLLSNIRVVGAGSAETSERLSEHGIAGRRAMEDALLKMQGSLLESKVFGPRGDEVPSQGKKQPSGSTSSRLAEIKALKDSGQITQEEYEVKRKAILDSL